MQLIQLHGYLFNRMRNISTDQLLKWFAFYDSMFQKYGSMAEAELTKDPIDIYEYLELKFMEEDLALKACLLYTSPSPRDRG